MARQKQVFPRDTVAHLWAHKAQDSARDSSGNFFFTGPTLYSYGSHFAIAHILSDECGPGLAGRVLWNDATYSNTTAKMQSIARQALTRQQWADALHMPGTIGMGRNTDPHAIERALIGKRLPDVAPLLIDRVIECVAELPKKKRDGGPFASLVSEAQKAETLAVLFYARAGKKYPLALIGDIPEGKAELLAWVMGYASTKMRADYAEALKAANHYAEQARINAAQCTDGFPYFDSPNKWEAGQVVGGTHDAAQKSLKHLREAARLYGDLNDGKKAGAVVKLQKEMQALADVFAARHAELKNDDQRRRLMSDIREAARMEHALRTDRKAGRPGFLHRYSDMETLANRAAECGLTDPLYMGLAARLDRIGTSVAVRESLRHAVKALEVAHSYMPAFPADAIRHASNVRERILFVERCEVAPDMLAHYSPRIQALQESARSFVASARVMVVEKHAETLRAWLACESNVRPSYEAGTYARINGAFVETTRGASVPIEHACRLSRMYAIAVRKGGMDWVDGAGPIVGHFRVNSIGADGSLMIGCHEFTAEEAKRLHALLEQCEACAGITADASA